MEKKKTLSFTTLMRCEPTRMQVKAFFEDRIECFGDLRVFLIPEVGDQWDEGRGLIHFYNDLFPKGFRPPRSIADEAYSTLAIRYGAGLHEVQMVLLVTYSLEEEDGFAIAIVFKEEIRDTAKNETTYSKVDSDEISENLIWDSINFRWTKTINGKRYRRSCKQLNLPKSHWTKEKSRDAAKAYFASI